jgi:hypothetical protein
MAKKVRPVGSITIVTGTYEKEGETKNRYLQIGTLFQRLDDNTGAPTNRMTIKLDALPPPNSDGQYWLNVYPIQKRDNAEGNQDAGPRDDGLDQPIDLSEIPF